MKKKLPTIQTIADMAGVSKTTVSRYLNDKFDGMSDETRNRIRQIIAETGYRPNRMANSLKTNHSGLIGFVMSNVMSNQTPVLLASICDACADNGTKIIVVNSEKNPEKERSLVYDLLSQRVDGLLVVSGYNSEFYRQLDADEVPVVFADRVPKDTDIDFVAINHTESTRRVISHLLSQGYERIILLKRIHKNPSNTPDIRANVAIKCCQEYFGDDSHCRSILVDYPQSQSEARTAFKKLTALLQDLHAESSSCPTAIFVVEASIMNMVSNSYYFAGLELSKSFTICGYSEWNMGAAIISPQITTIEQPLELMGKLATEILLKRIEERKNNIEDVRESRYLNCRITLAKMPEDYKSF